MKLFIESSALAKRYIEEVGSDEVREKCREATEIIISVITSSEVLSGLKVAKCDLFLSADHRQCASARSVGIRVLEVK